MLLYEIDNMKTSSLSSRSSPIENHSLHLTHSSHSPDELANISEIENGFGGYVEDILNNDKEASKQSDKKDDNDNTV